MRNPSMTPFYSELRRQGFKFTGIQYEDHRKHWTRMYEKIINTPARVKLDLQLWSDGGHRVSHWHSDIVEFGVMNTMPSEFKTVEEMKKAIAFESTRHARGLAKTATVNSVL